MNNWHGIIYSIDNIVKNDILKNFNFIYHHFLIPRIIISCYINIRRYINIHFNQFNNTAT